MEFFLVNKSSAELLIHFAHTEFIQQGKLFENKEETVYNKLYKGNHRLQLHGLPS